MHKLGRCVRFSVNPFLSEDCEGCNSFTSKPTGQGIAVFLELCVELEGHLEQSTGFVVNVSDIDEEVRRFVVPVFAERIRQEFRAGRHIGFCDIAKLLQRGWRPLAERFDKARLNRLSLKLNPLREVAIDSGESKMIYLSEKFEFAATHKLWNDKLSDEENFRVFGKCANPTGHGHNYVVEVTVKATAAEHFSIGDFERVIDDELIRVVDHRNLNADVSEFGEVNPTVENIAAFAWNRLQGKLGKEKLHCVTVWETDKTYCSYCED